MNVDALSDQNWDSSYTTRDAFRDTGPPLDSHLFHNNHFAAHRNTNFSLQSKVIKPMASGGARISGDVDKNGDWTISGELRFEWGKDNSENSENRSENKNEGTSNSDSPPDTRDRDTDNDS